MASSVIKLDMLVQCQVVETTKTLLTASVARYSCSEASLVGCFICHDQLSGLGVGMKEKANVTNLSFVSGKPFYELAKREERSLEVPRVEEPLVVPLIGTSGKKKKAVVAVESFSGKAATRSVEEFCQDSGLNMSSHFALSVYFEADANTLAREWCQKMSYFHELGNVRRPTVLLL